MTEFTRGDALRFVRKDVRNYDQREVATEARRLWLQARDREGDSIDPPNSVDSIRMAISRAEKDDRQLGKLQKRFVCEVLKVDPYFIEHFYTDEKQLREELTAWEAKKRKDEIFGRAEAETAALAARLKKRPPQDIEELARSTEEMSFQQRGPIGRALDDHVIANTETVILHVHGTTGSGKSTFLHFWFLNKKSALHGRPVLAINLENKTGDYVQQRIVKYLSRFSTAPFDSAYDAIMSSGRPVIVLDSIERFDASTAIGSPHSQQIAISELIRSATRPENSACIILISASDNASGAEDLIDDLRTAAGAAWNEVPFEGISTRDALKFLENKKVCRSDEERNSVVEYLHHNAALINAYATVKEGDNFSLIDKPLLEKMRSEDQVKVRIESLAKIFDVLRKEQPHDYVVFVILACSHEGLIIDDIATIYHSLVECGWPWTDKIPVSTGRDTQRRALKNCLEGPLSQLIRSSASHTSVRRVPEGAAKHRQETFRTLHYLAKEAIQTSLAQCLPPNAIAFVHYIIAILLAGRTPSGREQEYKPFITDIEYFHALIFHLISMFDLRQKADGGVEFDLRQSSEVLKPKARDPKLTAQVTLGSLSFENASRAPNEFLDTLYGDVMRKNLWREQYATSRQLGHYERKLAMLSLFLTDWDHVSAGDLTVREGIRESYQKAILLDIIVCANHCGKLLIAHAAARSLTRMVGETRHSLRDFRRTVATAFASEDVRELNASLDEYSNLMVAASTTYFREGDVRMSFKMLDRDVADILQEIAQNGITFPPLVDVKGQRRDYLFGILVSYRRIIAKYGQICSALGKQADAEAAYRVSEMIEQWRLPDAVPHRGESGRNFIRMLATYYAGEAGENGRIKSIVEANLQFSNDRNRYHEVIEWYVEKAWLALRAGRSDEIEESLARITKLTNEHQLHVSYVALREIELLSLILEQKVNGRVNKKDIDALIHTLRRSGHKLLLLEALRYKQSIDPREAETLGLKKEIEEVIEYAGVNPRWLRV